MKTEEAIHRLEVVFMILFSVIPVLLFATIFVTPDTGYYEDSILAVALWDCVAICGVSAIVVAVIIMYLCLVDRMADEVASRLKEKE